MNSDRNRLLTAAFLMLAAAVTAQSANANTVSFTGTDNGTPVSGSTTAIGDLTGPSNIVFTDVLTSNTTASAVTTVDDWTFSLPPSAFAGTVTGDQLWLKNFQVTGVIDSYALYSGTPGSGTLLATATVTGSFSSYLLFTITQSGSYYLQVQATLNPGTPSAPTSGSYTGTIATAPVPLPASLPLLLTGIMGMPFFAKRRARRLSRPS